MSTTSLLLAGGLAFAALGDLKAAVNLGIATAGANETILAWTSVANAQYNLQWSPVLAPPQWRSLAGVVTATNATTTARDTMDQAMRFYRVVTIEGKLALAETNSGTNVVLSAGTLLEVTLDANPSTGYQWVILPGMENVVRQLGQATYVSTSPGVGGGGKMTFLFECVGAGQTMLKLIYSRFGSTTGEPVKTFAVTVNGSP
jgi:inhibitor of cysteine peptidase